jgi:hypothetical protein
VRATRLFAPTDIGGTVNEARIWKPSPSLVVATIALIAGLAGTAYAAGLHRNSVKSKQIKDGSIQSIDVQDGTITATDLEASLAAKTFTVHRSFPADNADVELVSVPGIAVLTGRCGATNTSLNYRNSSAAQQVVSMTVNPATQGGAGTGQQNTGGVAPDKGFSLGVLQSTASEGEVRVAASGQYMNAEVLFAHPAGDSATCETWTEVTLSPDLGA